MKILVSDKLSDEGLALLQGTPDVEVAVRPGLSKEELRAIIGDFDAIIIRSGTRLGVEEIKAAKKLRVITRAGVGVDNVDVKAASRQGILVMNTPTGNTIATAELAITLMLALARRIPDAVASVKAGKWDRKMSGVQLFGKTLGVIGLGRVGGHVARRAAAFGMKVMGFDPYLSKELAAQYPCQVTFDLESLLAQADFVTFHVPLTAETKHLLDAKAFARMKKGVRIINCARGGIIDEHALADAIKAGIVAGAALDVYEEEPPKDRYLVDLPQVITTPHIGASTEEAQRQVAVDAVQQTLDALLRANYRYAVNSPAFAPEDLEAVKPYLALAEKMGALLLQRSGRRMERIEMIYAGEVARKNVTPLTMSLLVGLLGRIVEEPVNLVNVRLVAEEKGVRVEEVKRPLAGSFSSLLSVRLEAEGREHTVEGTVFGPEEPRLVSVDGYPVEIAPSGHLLFILNEDRPGTIGRIGTLLGEADVNIAAMANGRKRAGDMALTVLSLDSDVPAAVLEKLRAIPAIREASVVVL
ncbi:MAG: phosphoglycerate dehydrogenase [Planctomycetota bacterium]